MNDPVLQSALNAIPIAQITREEWINVGMALKQGGHPVGMWRDWSAGDPSKFHEGECEQKWDGFHGSSKPLKPGYIVKLAERYGWSRYENNGYMDWSDQIGTDTAEPATIPDHLDLDPADELVTYLETLFDSDDVVGYVTNDYMETDDRITPLAGTFDRTAGELIESIRKYQKKGKDLTWTIGTWNPQAGAWIRFNALDGQGVKNKNVKTFKFALVESDTMPIEDQERLYRELNLPIAAMVSSGGKSVHAIVKVDARNIEEYHERVDFLYEYLKKHGCEVDGQNKNPSRLSRMPGVTRNGNRQRLLAVNIGAGSWVEWKNRADGLTDSMPPLVTLSAFFDDPPELPPELIEGVLRCGHKMLISGASKAGKSFLLMELCLAIASGSEWIGLKCRKGKVLYVNLEIDGNSAINRFLQIAKIRGNDKKCMDDILIWNIRGMAIPLNDLIPPLIHRVKDLGLSAIIIDPIYKVITGDENNASEMGYFCNQFDKICTEANCAVIYCHHHSKGAQGAKRAMDRASGSGVFARDPDAQLDLIELELSDDIRNNVADTGASAWRIESSLREFENIKPINIWYEHPIHRVDISGELAKAFPEGDPLNNLKKSPNRTTSDQRWNDLIQAFEECSMGYQHVDINALAASMGRNQRTVRAYIKEFGNEFEVNKGMVWRKE